MEKKNTAKPQQILSKEPLRIEFDGGFRQLFVVLVLFILLFVLPVIYIDNLRNESGPAEAAATEVTAASSPGYNGGGTATAQQGRVAGISTSRYVIVPVLNFRLDTELKETDTLVFLGGAVCLILGGGLSLILMISDTRKNYR
jgi:hypothetical protein